MILSKIGHPNIIRVFDAGLLETDTGQHGYFTMEYVPGGTLDSWWSSFHKDSFIPIKDTMGVIQQICMGLTVAHSKKPPIIHRDIKPQNILVGYDAEGFRIRISDFGLAKTANPLTLLASARGTPVFKPPECMQNIDSCASDTWAIGVILYLLLTNRLPFPIESREDLSTNKWWKHEIVSPMEYNPRVDDTLEEITLKSLRLNYADRYQNAVEILSDLKQYSTQKSACLKNARNVTLDKNLPNSKSIHIGKKEQKRIKEILDISKDASRLFEAADLLEELLITNPVLRDKYEYRIKLWRRGLAM